MKKMYLWLFGIVMGVLSISLVGCDSAVSTNKEVPNSEKQKTLHQLKQISFILLDIAQKPEMIQIIKQGVDLKFDGDENILLDDLINPSQTFLKQSEVQHFKKIFEQTIQKSVFNKTNKFEIDSLISWIKESKVQVYWPYSELWDGKTNPTISYDPMEMDSDQNEGFKIVTNTDGTTKVETVVVNDHYANLNPVLILNFSNKSNEYIKSIKEKKLKTDSNKNTINNTYSTVYIEYVEFSKNWDSIFRGGNDFKFGRAEGYVKDVASSGAITGEGRFQSLGTVSCPRISIFKTRMVCGINLLWDSDWSDSKTSQTVFVSETDNGEGEVTISLGASIKNFPVKVDVKVPPSDVLLSQTEFKRDQYVTLLNHAVYDRDILMYGLSTSYIERCLAPTIDYPYSKCSWLTPWFGGNQQFKWTMPMRTWG